MLDDQITTLTQGDLKQKEHSLQYFELKHRVTIAV